MCVEQKLFSAVSADGSAAEESSDELVSKLSGEFETKVSEVLPTIGEHVPNEWNCLTEMCPHGSNKRRLVADTINSTPTGKKK